MKIRTPFVRTLLTSMLSLGVTAALIGVSAPAANAYTIRDISSTLTATQTSVTIDLSGVQYAAAPSGIYLDVQGSSCRGGGPVPTLDASCWGSIDHSESLNTNLNGVFTIDKLNPNTYYQVEVYAYENGSNETLKGIVLTKPDVNDAPWSYPTVLASKDGLSAKVTVGTEYNTWNLNDATPVNGLKYNVYAYYRGAWHKVISNATGGKSYTLSKLPMNTSIYFAETDVNTLGESAKSQNSGAIKLAPAAPYMSAPTGVIWPDKAVVKWKKAYAGAGHVTKYVLNVTKGSKAVYKHSFSSSKRTATVSKLNRKVIYTFSVTVYNNYGKHYTTEGVYGRSK